MVTRDGFYAVVANAYAGYGFPAEAPVNYIFPSEMFTTGSDLTPLEEHMEELLAGLTEWEPEQKETGLFSAELIDLEADSYQDVLASFQNMFRRNQWSDSFAVEPPTPEVVDWILTGTDKDPNEVISPEGGILPRGGIATVRALAVFMAMVGGRPEYMPLFIAMVQAQTTEKVKAQGWNATTNSRWPTFMVHGTMAKQIRLSSSYGLLGPDPARPAGGCIGRAMRLMQQVLGGSLPGNGTMSLFGMMKTTNAVFAEDEDSLPEGWPTVGEQRGLQRGEDGVTITLNNGLLNVFWDFGEPDTNRSALMHMAKTMAVPCKNKMVHLIFNNQEGDPDYMGGVVVLPGTFCQALKDNSGMSKDDVQNFLWENSLVSWDGLAEWSGERNGTPIVDLLLEQGYEEGVPFHYPKEPGQFTIICAGGDQGGHGLYMKGMAVGEMATVKIELPEIWDDLIFDAEIDMGPNPDIS